jgi:hypothetical protein
MPYVAHSCAVVSAVQPHALGVPPPPHEFGAVQVPQLATVRAWPQRSVSVTAPHVLPRRAQNAASVSFAQPHALATPPPPHVSGALHAPQLAIVRVLPH